MEDQINTTENREPVQSFAQPVKKNNSNSSKWLLIFIALLIVGGAGIFFFTSSANTPIPTPTPSFGVVPVESEITPMPTPTATPAVSNRSEVTIEVQNGTGITGEAKLLQDKLKELGYSEITVGNAGNTDYSDTEVTFKKSLNQSVVDEIKKELEGFYKSVTVKTATTQKTDVVIVTGLRGKQTANPSAKATSSTKSSATPTSSSKASSTPSASPSATPKI